MIDRNSPVPFYAQLKTELLDGIERNVWRPGGKLPGELDLCSSFSVSRTVVRQALQERVGLSHQSLYAVLERQYGISIASGKRIMEAVGASRREAELLQVPLGMPLMLLDSIGFLENGQPIEIFHALHCGDRARSEVLQTRQVPTSGRL